MPFSNAFKFVKEITDDKIGEDYYVYGWICEEWNYTFFYIGKGKGNRYKSLTHRSMAFNAIFNNNICFPVVLKTGLTVEEAEISEDKFKDEFILEKGYPIMDGENKLHSRCTRVAKEKLRAEGKKTDGRNKKCPPEFISFLSMQRKGEITVEQACTEMGICKTTWYERVKEISV